MAPGKQDILIRRGDPWSFAFSSSVDDVPEPINPVLVLAQIRDTPDGAVVADLAAGITVSTAPSGEIIATLSLTAAQTTALAPGCYIWDLQPDPAGETWLAGNAEISADVSHTP